MLAPYLIVAVGGSVGAIARYASILCAQSLWGTRFPWGTLIANMLGSCLAGFLLFSLIERFNASEYWRLFLFTGFLGAYTTFSSFSAETLLMYRAGQWSKLCANIILNNVGSLAMVLIGALLAGYLVATVHQP